MVLILVCYFLTKNDEIFFEKLWYLCEFVSSAILPTPPSRSSQETSYLILFENFKVLAQEKTVKMFSRFQRPATQMVRQFSTSKASNNKVAVMGASGGKHNFFEIT